jgi:hypothetical protein
VVPKSVWTVVGEEENLLSPPDIEPGFLGHPARNLVTIPTPVDLCDKKLASFCVVPLRTLTVVQLLKKFYIFAEHGRVLPSSREPTTCSCKEPAECCSQPQVSFR